MSLLAPLFLLGALAIAGPIVAHLMRRNTRDRVAFSATQFLEASKPRLDRRNRIEHPWLLLLRVLAVLVLALGFARPFLREAPATLRAQGIVRHRVIVLDASASMRRQGLWPAALDRLRQSAGNLAPSDALAIITAGDAPETLLASDAWKGTAPSERASLLKSTIDGREPGWGPTRLDSAVERALEELTTMRETGAAPTESTIVIISDLADGARISGLAGRDWPEGVHVEIDSVARPAEPNASLHWLGWAEGPDGTRVARLRVAHDALDSRSYTLALRATDGAGAWGQPTTLILAPREVRAVALPFPVDDAVPAEARLTGDAEPFDNTVWIVPPARRQAVLAYWGAGDAADPRSPLYFITRAVRGWRDPAMSVVAVAPAATGPASPLHIVTRPLSAPEFAGLREQLEGGATVLVLARDADGVGTSGALAAETAWVSGPEDGHADLLLADIAFSHPLFAAFADPRYSDFTHVRFWRSPHLALPAQSSATVIARFDDGSPAVVEKAIGRGTLVVWAGDWTPESSQWVLSSKFVPWFQGLARRTTGGPPAPSMAEVGDSGVLRLPSGVLANRPGIATFTAGETTRTVALNVPAVESRTTLLPLDAWEALGVPLTANASTAAAADHARRAHTGALAAARLEGEQRLWRWLLLAAVVILGIESLAAFRAAAHPAARAASARV